MAEQRFYGSIPLDETSTILNFMQQQRKLQQQQQLSLQQHYTQQRGMGQSLPIVTESSNTCTTAAGDCTDYSLLPNSTYSTTTPAITVFATGQNEPTVTRSTPDFRRFFEIEHINCHSYSKPLFPCTGFYTPYTGHVAAVNYIPPAPPGTLPPGVVSTLDSLAAAVDFVAPDAFTNGNASCYNRNRYIPYRNNRACAATTASAGTAASLSDPYQHHAEQQQQQQQFGPLYTKTGHGVATDNLPAHAGGTAQNLHTFYERASVASQKSVSSAAELSHANANNPTFGGGGASGAGIRAAAMSAAASALMKKLAIPVTTLPSTVVSTAVTSTASYNASPAYASIIDTVHAVTLQITNLDYSMDEESLRTFLLNQLQPITPVLSLLFDGTGFARVTVPDLYFAKQVVSNMHRKKIGHKRMLVSYTRDSSLTEINTLRCQVAGLLKDVPHCTLPMYKFRELFQSRFKTSISVLDLYKMQDICIINTDSNDEKYITLQADLQNSLEGSPLMEGLQHSVPYCTIHFKREQHKGWAEQEIEPLPNVFMTIAEIQKLIYPLLKNHPGDIPVASLVHCIDGELNKQITPNENGVNLEHLVCCVQGIQIQMNNFGIKILGWLELDKDTISSVSATDRGSGGGPMYKNPIGDPLYQISREVIELVKMSPKSTMKFNRFIPAYHNHFGKQCRVADYGYTKLIELFEALSSVVQIMGDGENRQITLTHRTQVRRFTSDLLRVLRANNNKAVLLSQLPNIFAQTQNRTFDVTDYGVCDIVDILDGLVNSNIVVVTTVQQGKDILISVPKRKQTSSELEKTSTFAGEMVELFRNAAQYTIFFQKFVRSYHYHFAYQCRLNDYGFLKLADLMEAIHGVVEMETNNDEDRKIFLSPKVARRVFAEQCEELIRSMSGASKTCIKLVDVLRMHKKKFGYQIQPQTLGVMDITKAIELMPYVEMLERENHTWIICHSEDALFRTQCYRACKHLLTYESEKSFLIGTPSAAVEADAKAPTLNDFISDFNTKLNENLKERTVKAMKHAIMIFNINDVPHVRLTSFIKFLMNIVRLLEQRATATTLLLDIKNALDCSLTTTFEFGYPNLYTVLTAYPDIFAVNLGITQERSEVSLLANAELRLSTTATHQHLFGSLKLPSLKLKSMRAMRAPLADQNARVTANDSNLQCPTPAKMRAISVDSNNNNNNSSAIPFQFAAYKTPINNNNNNNNYYKSTTKAVHAALQQLPTSAAQPNSNTSISSIFNTSEHNKENSFNNSSLNMLNSSFNSSSTSNTESNKSVDNNSSNQYAATMDFPIITQYGNAIAPTKLWDRRHALLQQPIGGAAFVSALPALGPPLHQHHANNMPISQQPLAFAPTQVTAAANSIGLYELVNNIQMFPMYEPPKPDTPPTDAMPFWIDPIWTNATNEPKNELLNIKLPEFKNFNVLPMLLSPYTLSKTENMKQNIFNFDNHDRKIA